MNEKEPQQSPDFPDCFYRVTVKGLCVRDGKALLVREAPELSGQWELPGGGLDFGEEPRTCLEREIKEEMGLDVVRVSEQPIYAWTNYEKDRRSLKWYYSLVLVYQIEFKDLAFTATEECEEVAFYSREELQTLDLYHQALKLREVFDPKDFE